MRGLSDENVNCNQGSDCQIIQTYNIYLTLHQVSIIHDGILDIKYLEI